MSLGDTKKAPARKRAAKAKGTAPDPTPEYAAAAERTCSNVAPGWYRVRSLGRGFATIDESSMEGDDYYSVVLWPAQPAELRVVKQWAEHRK